MDTLNHLLQSMPPIIAIVIWAVRLEIRITRMANDIKWIKTYLPKCQQNSDNTI